MKTARTQERTQDPYWAWLREGRGQPWQHVATGSYAECNDVALDHPVAGGRAEIQVLRVPLLPIGRALPTVCVQSA